MKFKKIAMMGLAAMMAVSAMSISAFAEDIPMHSQVDTSLATQERPVTYIDEETGTTVTIYDPNITVSFSDEKAEDIMQSRFASSISGTIFVPQSSATALGRKTKVMTANSTGSAHFTLTDFDLSSYNVSLNQAAEDGSTSTDDSTLVVLENKPADVWVALRGMEARNNYYFRVSSWLGSDSTASYEAY